MVGVTSPTIKVRWHLMVQHLGGGSLGCHSGRGLLYLTGRPLAFQVEPSTSAPGPQVQTATAAYGWPTVTVTLLLKQPLEFLEVYLEGAGYLHLLVLSSGCHRPFSGSGGLAQRDVWEKKALKRYKGAEGCAS